MLLFLTAFVLSTPVVSDTDILMTKQTYGECHRDLSVDGNKLTIAGVSYEEGIGTHATSMIPITVPAGANKLTGACGIDDEIGNPATVKFSILSGSEVLWISPVMTNKVEAQTFSVDIPKGSKRLYLFADEVDTNENDHSDWVNLKWEYENRISSQKNRYSSKNNNLKLKAGVLKDQGPTLRKMISDARENQKSSIVIEKGEYHFYEDGALKMTYHVSNHDQPTFQPVGVPLIDLENVTIDCQNSTFIFHGLIEPFVVMDSYNVTIKNVHIDFYRPFYTEATIVATGFFSTTLSIDRTKYPYHVHALQFVFENEGFSLGATLMYIFNRETKRIYKNNDGISFITIVTENADGSCNILMNLQGHGAQIGDVVVIRSWDRPHPGIFLYRAKKTHLYNVHVHSAEGMALLAQRSEDIYIEHSGANYGGDDRYHSSSCDATHFSNDKGEIIVRNCLFEGMLDDAINVHSTSLKITEIVNNSAIKLQYMHEQSVGFETFLPGEKIQFIKSGTMELSEIRVVSNVRKMSTTELLVTIDGNIPSDISSGDAVENADYYPSVIFENNTIRNNVARGSLFTTPKSVKVRNNFFDYTSGAALLLAGDTANWYESGKCTDVEIKGNIFINPLTSTYQFTKAIFSFYPTISSVSSQQVSYHANVLIEDNYFDIFDIPILYAISTENITIRNNKIKYNNDFPGWGEKTFQLHKCKNLTLASNEIIPEKTWSIDDVSLDQTDSSEVHFQ
ncbi:Alpha-1,3-galactosidase B [Tritrichomonas foetus]|uniref:Alpha-1,3-galactosidase B n=1 Tax=Tritrichomonas foetus TaxID=1144522 RepID=A0A1J4JNB4_9EUKA|nr:Alpha-1,3-galactosidase B [Tritrichomonas foetus]|eukprot:OHS98997.1 Alpha-1,3-galactosidase B [Tritrichomonas foetus]